MSDKLRIRITGGLISLVNLIFCFLFLSEYYIVGIYKKSNSAYPFGEADDEFWFYRSAEAYAKHSLIIGLCFLIPLICLIYFLIKFKYKPALVFSIILVLLDFLLFTGILNWIKI